MRYGIPLLGERVAPRCACADTMLVVTCNRGRITGQERLPLDITSPVSLTATLRARGIDSLVCGGLGRPMRETLAWESIHVIDNVACSADQALDAIARGKLRSGYGFDENGEVEPDAAMADEREPVRRTAPSRDPWIDCLACTERICLEGRNCVPEVLRQDEVPSSVSRRMLETATDIATERERRLCRLAELVYFCLEMKFTRIGIAFCEDLREPASILSGVLDRSFDTIPVCCKVGGTPIDPAPLEAEGARSVVPPISCNPAAQAAVLNRAGCDLNVVVGLCMGADCIFARLSEAPATTLFVKDRSLANNPIGAVYSDYYLRESASPDHAAGRMRAAGGTTGKRSGIAETAPKREERS